MFYQSINPQGGQIIGQPRILDKLTVTGLQ